MADWASESGHREAAEYLCANEWYLWSVELDFAYWLNGLSDKERRKVLDPARRRYESPHCPMCGSACFEYKDDREKKRIARCTEETCRNTWEW